MKTIKKPIIIFLSLILSTSIFCSSETKIQAPEKIIDIPIETQTMTIIKTKVELPTLMPTFTSISFSTITLEPTTPPGESTTTPTQWIYISSTPRPTPLCYCNRNYDCVHFYTQKQAQICFDYCNGSRTNNWSGLDADHDGIACEDLP